MTNLTHWCEYNPNDTRDPNRIDRWGKGPAPSPQRDGALTVKLTLEQYKRIHNGGAYYSCYWDDDVMTNYDESRLPEDE